MTCGASGRASAIGVAGPAVAIPAAVRRRLDAAFVLEADVAAAVAAAEAGGPRFSARPGGGLYACDRPGSVTHWVEYVRASDGPEVRDVYSHRMEVVGVVDAATGSAGIAGAGERPA